MLLRRQAKLCVLAATCMTLAGCVTSTPEQASSSMRELTAISPATGEQNSHSLLMIANAMASEGAYGAAIPVYRRAYEKEGDMASRLGLGKALAAVGNYSEAAKVFKGSDNPDALRGLANAYTAMGRPGDALPLLDKALATNPVDVDAMNSRAVVLDVLGRHDEAVDTYERGLAVDPQNVGLGHNYGLSLALAGSDLPRAVKLLKESAGNSAATATERQSLALAYALAGDDTTAEHLLSIDLGVAETHEKMAYFGLIKALPVAERYQAVLSGSVTPKPEKLHPAYRSYGSNDSLKADAAIRVIAAAPPVPGAAPAPVIAAAAPPAAPEVAPAPEPAPAPAKPAPEATPANNIDGIPADTAETGWTIQIAAYRRSGELKKGWQILARKYEAILGSLAPSYAKVDFGNREKRPKGQYLRLLSGPMKNRAEAEAACGKLRAEGAECIVRAPGTAGSNRY